MNPHELLNQFWEMNRLGVDAEGIRIPNAFAVDPEDGLTVMAMAMLGQNGAQDAYLHFAKVLVREKPEQLVFGLDRFVLEGQGVRTKDLLSVHYWDGRGWSFGVIAYQHEPAIFDPIDWNNAHWIAALRREQETMFGRLNVPRGRPRSLEFPLHLAATNGPITCDKSVTSVQSAPAAGGGGVGESDGAS